MTIRVGDRMPDGTFTIITPQGVSSVRARDVFDRGRTVLIGVEGAFTPNCHGRHLPGFVQAHDALAAHGVGRIACLAVNDVFVLDAWARASGAEGRVLMLADGNADYTRALGLALDLSHYAMGTRTNRFSMIIEDGHVRALHVDAPDQCEVSTAERLLADL